MHFKREKSDIETFQYEELFRKALQHCFQVQSIIQDILQCQTSMEELTHLNELGRSKINVVREEIENLEVIAQDTNDEKLLEEVKKQKENLSRIMRSFKKANLTSLLAIEKAQRDELIKPKRTVEDDETAVRNRSKADKSGFIQMSSGVTEHLLSISRQLSDTTQRSQDTLDNLVMSSTTVTGTRTELENTAGKITQSSKLLQKYGRREFTDKLVIFFVFLFFLACVFYVLHRRLF